MNSVLQSREHAGQLLSKKLTEYANTDAVVVGIPHGGVCVAAAIAETLSLPLEVMPCRRIKHPASSERTIGSVSINDIVMEGFQHDIPQDYIYHQIGMLRNALRHEYVQYYGNMKPLSLHKKTVILVDDILRSRDTLLACLRGIRKQHPLKIVVAIPIVSADAVLAVESECDELVILQMEPAIESGEAYFENFPAVDAEKVKRMLDASRENLVMNE